MNISAISYNFGCNNSNSMSIQLHTFLMFGFNLSKQVTDKAYQFQWISLLSTIDYKKWYLQWT